MTKPVATGSAYFIKLGRGGEWEAESLKQGTLRFGYGETPHELCTAGAWDEVRDFWTDRRGDAGAATRDMKQIRAFYESDETSIFITFANGLLYWCRPVGPVEVLADKTHRRATINGWSSQSLGGVPLSSDRISGHMLKVQMFRGTICQVKQRDYLLRKLNDEQSPELENADEAERAMIAAIIGLMRLLTWQDFELLVDLVFSASGWRRVLSGCNRYMGSRARCVKYTIANIGDAGLGCAPIRSMAPSLWMQRPPHSGIRSGG